MRQVLWGVADLEDLRADQLAGKSLLEMAERQGPDISAADCDRALWALVGRTYAEAADALNKRRAA